MKAQYTRCDWRGNYYYYLTYGSFKTASQQERRLNYRDKEFVRAKRWPNNLVDSYDDIWPSRCKVKSWKDRTKKRKQYER